MDNSINTIFNYNSYTLRFLLSYLRLYLTEIKQDPVRSQLEAEINVLGETRYQNAVKIIEELASNILR